MLPPVNVLVPPWVYTPPPWSSVAVFPVIVSSVNVFVPDSTKTPPPESAVLSLMVSPEKLGSVSAT